MTYGEFSFAKKIHNSLRQRLAGVHGFILEHEAAGAGVQHCVHQAFLTMPGQYQDVRLFVFHQATNRIDSRRVPVRQFSSTDCVKS